MTHHVKELWRYQPMSATGMLCPRNGRVGGFICATTGTIKITEGETSGGATILDTTAVTGGVFLELGLICPLGAYVTITSAAGTFQI